MWSSIQRTQPLFRREHELEFSENVKKENSPSTGQLLSSLFKWPLRSIWKSSISSTFSGGKKTSLLDGRSADQFQPWR
jgi:hypothetical protein